MVDHLQFQKKFYIYRSDIDFNMLNLHLQMLPDAIMSTPLNGIHIKEVTKISAICDVLMKHQALKKYYQKFTHF